MSTLYKTLEGVGGQLDIYPDKVIIKREGALAKMTYGLFKGEKTIYIKRISGIQIKEGSLLSNGYIQFTLSGGVEIKTGIMAATQDENTVMFKKQDNVLVRDIKSYIENKMNEIVSGTSTGGASSSIADEILKLKNLFDQGILTQAEFKGKKRKLLDL